MMIAGAGWNPSGLVRSRREKLGWNRAQLAARAGVSRGTIKNIELRAARPSFENTLRVLSALGCEISVEVKGI